MTEDAMGPTNIPPFDDLVAECARHFLFPEIRRAPNGTWSVTLWNSHQDEYSYYNYAITPSEGLHFAIQFMLSGQTKTLQSPDPIAAGHDLSTIMQSLKAAIPAEPPISRIRKWDE